MYNRLNNTIIIIILVIVSVIALRNSDPFKSKSELSGKTGLVSVDCWFKANKSMSQSECFQMQVPEDHANSQSKLISFPVVLIRLW